MTTKTLQDHIAILRAAIADFTRHACVITVRGVEHVEETCVIDTGDINNCTYAARYGSKARDHCGSWKPIKVIKDYPAAESIAAVLDALEEKECKEDDG